MSDFNVVEDLKSRPQAQVLALAETMDRLQDEGVDAVWHPNHCGCCVSVHAKVDPLGGYVIGPDGKGGDEWVETVE